jgi:hypothetical protein
VESGGDATIIDAHLVDGLTDTEVEALFRSARDVDYQAVAEQARTLAKQTRGKVDAEKRATLEAEIARLERRIADIVAIDYFDASGREHVSAAIRALRERLLPDQPLVSSPPLQKAEAYRSRVWVTRTGIHVDRIACAWLIRRFIDREATFKFVPAKSYVPEPGELRFDMFDAEFSHVGDLCTFEVLCAHLALKEPGLRAIAEVVHDIDLKDGKYGRPETEGVKAQIAGLALLHREDETRLARGSELFEELLAYYARRKAELRGREPSDKGRRSRK